MSDRQSEKQRILPFPTDDPPPGYKKARDMKGRPRYIPERKVQPLLDAVQALIDAMAEDPYEGRRSDRGA